MKKEDIKPDGHFNKKGGAKKSMTDSPGAKKICIQNCWKMLPCAPYSITCKKAWACLVAKLLRSLS